MSDDRFEKGSIVFRPPTASTTPVHPQMDAWCEVAEFFEKAIRAGKGEADSVLALRRISSRFEEKFQQAKVKLELGQDV